MSAVTPLAPQRAARIATQLMELIELQKLIPGDKLPPERQLADLLEVSRPSLREALHILQARFSTDKARARHLCSGANCRSGTTCINDV